MNATPALIDIHILKEKIESIEGVKKAYHIHVWNQSSELIAMSAHILVPDQMLSDLEGLANRIRKSLQCDFNIAHPTFQFECKPYKPSALLCSFQDEKKEDHYD